MTRKSSIRTSSDVVGAAELTQSGAPSGHPKPSSNIAGSAVAARLIDPVSETGAAGAIFLARSEVQAEEVARAFKQYQPDAQVILLPPWDCLPYDRVDPSRESMGRRVAAIAAIAATPKAPVRFVVASPEAALQQFPPFQTLAAAFLTLEKGETLELVLVRDRLVAAGYLLDDRVDEQGEFALLGQGFDVFPPASPHPYRVMMEDGRIASIRSYDPLTQRTDTEVATVTLVPATELPGHAENTTRDGIEARMLAAGLTLTSLFDVLPNAKCIMDPAAAGRFETAVALIDDARNARDEQKRRVRTKEQFYLDGVKLKAKLRKRQSDLDTTELERLPHFQREPNPTKAAAQFISDTSKQGVRVALAGTASELNRLVKALQRKIAIAPVVVDDWAHVRSAKPGKVIQFEADLDAGFMDRKNNLAVVTTADVFGTRLSFNLRDSGKLLQEPDLRIGDVVLHEDHGIGVLRALETVEIDGAVADTVRLEYHGGATLLAPVEEFGRVWRYGADEDAVTLDKLRGNGWAKRRAQLDEEINVAAAHLVALAMQREAASACKFAPPRGSYARFAAKFPYPETPDQTTAIAEIIEDLGSGKAMNRLICGDVGFGKTEVALRAAAIVALNGSQVAVVAPTTVLARQHFETFSRRFPDLQVALLSRAVRPPEAKSVKAGLADGSVNIVVATNSIASNHINFANLALVILDEEHRFGVTLKQKLRELTPQLHVLSMSATPIPRTLASAMVGVQEASLLTTPPARRRPVRTELAPYDAASLKTALIREKRRNGQSFCVVPRIEDIDPTAAELKKLVPNLSIETAHGDMDAAAMDEAMMRFANGHCDILLSTNIIENGLDVPRANTITVFRADRFGLAQLHQMRGRVGRGRAQGCAYLLTDANKEISSETRSRLSALLAFDRLGSGLSISARDLDLRGAGDLVGEEQTGHMKLVGLSLYQRLLAQAVERTRCEFEARIEPDVRLNFTGSIPANYVPEAVVRLNLYSQLQRFETVAQIAAFAEELEDRFGAPPPETALLIDTARIKVASVSAGIRRIGAGPDAISIEFVHRENSTRKKLATREDCKPKDGRLIFAISTETAGQRVDAVKALLDGCLA